MYSHLKCCSCNFVLREEDPEAIPLFEELELVPDPLVEEAYVSLHLAYDVPRWASPKGNKTACMCSSIPGMREVSLGDEFNINLDCGNARNMAGCLAVWEVLRSKMAWRRPPASLTGERVSLVASLAALVAC